MRTLFDSTKAADIPAGSELVAGYVDGSSAWSFDDWGRFPGRIPVRLCVFNNRFDADVIDIEPGNNDANGAVPWVAGKWAKGQTPTVYCFSDGGPTGYRISDVRDACDKAGVKRPLFWIAQWDNDPSTFDPSGDKAIVAKQYANPTFTGGHYDASVVADYWQGVDGMTPEQEAKLDAILAYLKSADAMVWAARIQRSLDVETGKVFDGRVPAQDTRIGPK